MKKKLLLALAGIMLAITQSFAVKSPVVYTDEAAFKVALQSPYYLEIFSDLSEGLDPNDFTRSSGDYAYNITTYYNNDKFSLYNWKYVVCTSDYRANLIINNTGTSINAIGGNFYLTNDALAYNAGNVQIVAGTDTISVTPTSASSFIGIVFPQSVSKVYIISKSPAYGTYISLSNLYVGKASAINATAGSHTYDVSSLGFANADIVKLVSGTDSTDAVVADGKIDFYAPSASIYSVIKKSTVAKSMLSSMSCVTNTSQGTQGSYGGVLAFGQYKGVGDEVGTANRPLTGLTHFIGIGAAQTGNMSSSWKQANTFAGYDWFGTTASTRGKCYIVAEDRNETTGKLLASLYFDPTISEVGPESLKGPLSYNFIFNPTNEIITNALVAHSAYSGNTSKQTAALDSCVAIRDGENSMLLANVQFMRAFCTKAKTYTFDIATISGGKFKTGDVLELKYLLGSYDLSVYHSGNSAAVSALETFAQAQVAKDTVDADGYVKFNIYGGGFLSLSKKIDIPTSLSSDKANASVIYPLPAINSITIKTEADLVSVDIVDLNGQLILSSKDSTIDVSALKTGLYLAKITSSAGVVTKQLIKK